MEPDISFQLGFLVVLAVIAWLVWLFYRNSTYPATAKYATFSPRFWTSWVDSVVLWPISFVVSLLLAPSVPPVVHFLATMVQQGAWLGYSVAMHAGYGQTIGKMACKVKVVDCETEQSITLRQAVLRDCIPIAITLCSALYEGITLLSGGRPPFAVVNGKVEYDTWSMVLGSLMLLWSLAEFITMLTNKKRRAIHDYIAGTVCIRTNLE